MSTPFLSSETTSVTGRKLGYARVSTHSQTTDQQVAALRKDGCVEVFVDDGVRATDAVRPAMNKIKAALKSGDVFVVWAIDRAFRSTMEAIVFLDELMRRRIEFKSLTQAIDTRTPEGRKWYIDTASWAEYEREIISRRTREKMAHARSVGKHIGRPYKMTEQQALQAYELITEGGKPLHAVASKFGIAPVTVTRAFMRFGLEA